VAQKDFAASKFASARATTVVGKGVGSCVGCADVVGVLVGWLVGSSVG
jgi:hypothetical protein